MEDRFAHQDCYRSLRHFKHTALLLKRWMYIICKWQSMAVCVSVLALWWTADLSIIYLNSGPVPLWPLTSINKMDVYKWYSHNNYHYQFKITIIMILSVAPFLTKSCHIKLPNHVGFDLAISYLKFFLAFQLKFPLFEVFTLDALPDVTPKDFGVVWMGTSGETEIIVKSSKSMHSFTFSKVGLHYGKFLYWY